MKDFKYSKCDEIDVQSYNWYLAKSRGQYRVIANVDNKIMYFHRYILGILDPKIIVDHINGDPLDNRRENLRVCSHNQNLKNRRMSIKNTSGYKGVSFSKSTGKWLAQIKVNYKNHYLGLFDTKEAAYLSYCEAAKKYFGAFARLS